MEPLGESTATWQDLPNEMYVEIIERLPVEDIIHGIMPIDTNLYSLSQIPSIKDRVKEYEKVCTLFQTLTHHLSSLSTSAKELLKFDLSTNSLQLHHDDLNNFITTLAAMDLKKTLRLIDQLPDLNEKEKTCLKAIALSESDPIGGLKLLSEIKYRLNVVSNIKLKGYAHALGSLAKKDPNKAIESIKEIEHLSPAGKRTLFKRVIIALALTDPATAHELIMRSNEFEQNPSDQEAFRTELFALIDAPRPRQQQNNLVTALDDPIALIPFIFQGSLFSDE